MKISLNEQRISGRLLPHFDESNLIEQFEEENTTLNDSAQQMEIHFKLLI